MAETGPDGIKLLKSVPKGFLSLNSFAEKCGVSKQAIQQAKASGKIQTKNMRWVRNSARLADKNQRAKLYIHWENEGHTYILNRPPDQWPDGYEPPDRFLQGGGQELGKNTEQTRGLDTDIVNTNQSRLRKDLLEIQKREIELQISKNRLIEIEEVAGLLREIAVQTRQSMLAIIPRCGPIYAAETDQHKIMTHLEREIKEAIAGLEDLENYAGK